MKQLELERLICRELIEHDIVFLSDLLRNMSIDIECPFCTTLLEQLMAMRRDLKKELLALKGGHGQDACATPATEKRRVV